jgi:hypothetical protein
MNHDTHRCAICRAEFASSAELVRHEKARHTQQGISGVSQGNEHPTDEGASAKSRQGRAFTRRNQE